MPRMSKKRRLEWSFFLRQVKVGNTTCDRITYNDLCRGCTHKMCIRDRIGAYDITADELLAGTDTAKTESKTAQAQMLILELLANGKRMPSAEPVSYTHLFNDFIRDVCAGPPGADPHAVLCIGVCKIFRKAGGISFSGCGKTSGCRKAAEQQGQHGDGCDKSFCVFHSCFSLSLDQI